MINKVINFKYKGKQFSGSLLCTKGNYATIKCDNDTENILTIPSKLIITDKTIAGHPIYTLNDTVEFKTGSKYNIGRITCLKKNRAIIEKEDNSEVSVPYTLLSITDSTNGNA
jgi:hypothetical protein